MSSSQKTTAIVLAAGRSQRMGSPKPLLQVEDANGNSVTVLERVIAMCGALDFKVRVVLGYHANAIRNQVSFTGAEVLVNPDPGRGQTSSIQAGLTGVPGPICLFPVDHALIMPTTLQQLQKAFLHRKTGTEIVLPTVAGRRGHPVLVSALVTRELAQLSVTAPAYQVMRRDPARVLELPCDDLAAIEDFDTPEQFTRLRERLHG